MEFHTLNLPCLFCTYGHYLDKIPILEVLIYEPFSQTNAHGEGSNQQKPMVRGRAHAYIIAAQLFQDWRVLTVP